MHRQTRVRMNREATFFIEYNRTKRSTLLSPTPPPPYFCHHSLKLLSRTLLKLMNWILLSPHPCPPTVTPPKIWKCTFLDSKILKLYFLLRNTSLRVLISIAWSIVFSFMNNSSSLHFGLIPWQFQNIIFRTMKLIKGYLS